MQQNKQTHDPKFGRKESEREKGRDLFTHTDWVCRLVRDVEEEGSWEIEKRVGMAAMKEVKKGKLGISNLGQQVTGHLNNAHLKEKKKN